MLKAVKMVLKALGLQRVAWRVVLFLVKIKPLVTAKRSDLVYALDLRELIDFSIFMGGWEPETIDFLRKNILPGDCVIEAGANIGAHTLVIAQKVGPQGRVFAFEPTAYARNKLLRNISLNPSLASRIVVREDFVTDHMGEPGVKEIRSSWRMDNDSRLPETINSKYITVDELCASEAMQKVSLIKIDVDGSDYKVLMGARETIKKFKPVIFIELCEYVLKAQGDSIVSIFSELSSLGYTGFYEDGSRILSADDVLRLVGSDTSINGIFRPN